MTGSRAVRRIRQNPGRIRDVSMVVAGILLFALFIHDPFPRRALAFVSMAVTALIIALTIRKVSPWEAFGLGPFRPGILYYLLPSLLLGAALAWLIRSASGLSRFPGSLALTALIAPLIGATEELLFRGYIQGYLGPLGRFFSIIYTAAVHTCYKLLVILSLGTPLQFDFFFLILWTFLGGLAFGILREGARNVAPPMLAHAAFDIVLYGDHVVMPVWVWC